MRSAIGLAIVGLTLCMSPLAASAATPKVVVVPAQGKGAPNLKTQIASFVEKSLKQTVTVVPFSVYNKAAKAAGVRAKSITGPEAAVPAGKGAGASHVLLIQSVQEKGGGRKPTYYASVTLVDTATGETLLSKRYPLDGKRLDATAGSLIVGDVLPRMQPKSGPTAPGPAAEAEAAPAIVAPEPPPPPSGTGPQAPQAPPPLEAPPPPSGVPPEVPHNGGAPQPLEGGAVAAQDPNAAPPTAADANTAHGPRWRPGLRASIGYQTWFRTAKIDGGAGSQPPCYCEPAGVAAPAFSRGILQLELFPIAFAGDGSWYEGFGLHADGDIGAVHTSIGDSNTTSSTVGGIGGGLQFRYVLWDSPTATDLQLRLGLSVWSFPLTGTEFPGVQYKSPYVGLHANIPFTDSVGIYVQAQYLFRVVSGGGTQVLGTQLQAGSGVHAELGFRLTLFELLELKALANLDDYSVPFSGTTQLQGTNLNYQNVKLNDLAWGIGLGVGFII